MFVRGDIMTSIRTFLLALLPVLAMTVATAPAGSQTPHCLRLPGGQVLGGELLGLDDQRLRFRTAWGQEVVVPRQAVASVGLPPGLPNDGGRHRASSDLHPQPADRHCTAT